ncbi:MAG: ABC transporter permease [bacterium]|nr:ABC transporter permease [bacterium]
MTAYIVRRLALMVPLLVGVSLVTFTLLYLVPGDPVQSLVGERATPQMVESIRRELGLDLPLHLRYGRWLARTVRGDLGRSWATHRPVMVSLIDRFPITLKLSVLAFALSTLLGVTVGVATAVREEAGGDHLARWALLGGQSVPIIYLCLVFMYVFGVWLRLTPVSGLGDGSIRYFLLPAGALGLYTSVYKARMTRSAMLEVLRQDYIRTARAKGLSERVVIYRHALKNAMVTVVTVLGAGLSALLVGSVLTETVFGLPGIGKLQIDGVYARDFPVVMGCFLFQAVVLSFTNLAMDMAYAWANPRIRFD